MPPRITTLLKCARQRRLISWWTPILASGSAETVETIERQRRVMRHVITQELMAVIALVILWLESTEAELAVGRA